MYVGHAAIALALKSRYPTVPLPPLALACVGPDLVEAAFMITGPRGGMALYTHSVPAVFIGAVLAAGIFALFTRRRDGAFAIFAGWMLHWPADFLTGLKPITAIDALVGLDLYHLRAADFALESLFVLVGCALYTRVFAPLGRQRRIVVALGAVLVVLQGIFLMYTARTERRPWSPSLALVRMQAHLGHQSKDG